MKTEQTMSASVDPNSVRKVVSVEAPPVVAWRVFTEKMGTWWPLAIYKIGKTNAVDAVIEPHVGGAGTSAVTMEARVTGVACCRGNRTHDSCFRGILAPIGSPISL
jgi:hypothetical protein